MWCFVLQTQECTDEDVAKQADRGNRCSDVEVLLVRCVQKEIDNLDGKLKDTAWNALVTTSQSLKVLQVRLVIRLQTLLLACIAPFQASSLTANRSRQHIC